MSSRSSTRKKPEVTEISDDSEEEKSEDESEIVSLSDDAESTEEVAPKKSRACTYNKSAFSMPDDISKLMNRVLCTACGKQLNPMNHGAVRKHPWLKVVTCKKCYKFLKSGPYTRDKEGIDEQCRWCGDGGRLYGCDFCHNCFCRSCIKRNLGRTEAADMENQDPKTKWKCYMCKPNKIKSLVENCSKILGYIKKEEEKEKQREERAKQREKEKAAAAKEKKAQIDGNKSSDKKEKRNSLPLPNFMKKGDENKDKTLSKSSFPAPKPKDCIVIDSPEKPVFKHATAKSHLPSYNSRPGDGVTQVQKVGNGMTQVVVGPKAKMPVSMPYRDNSRLNAIPSVNVRPHQMPVAPQRPNLYAALSNHMNTGTVRTPSLQTANLDKKGISKVALANDLKAMKDQIVPFNVETITDKMTTVAQAFSLTINSVKTDLAIAKLSSNNLFNSRTAAALNVKTGFEVFFRNIREIFNVQVAMNSPEMNDASNPISIDDDLKESVNNEPSLPNGNDTKDVKECDKVKSETAEVKEENKANMKMETDETKAVKGEVKGEIKTEKDEIKTEKDSDLNLKADSKSTDDENEKMQTDDDANLQSSEKGNAVKNVKGSKVKDKSENHKKDDKKEKLKEKDDKSKLPAEDNLKEKSGEESSETIEDSGKNFKGARSKKDEIEPESSKGTKLSENKKSSKSRETKEDSTPSKSRKSSKDAEASSSKKDSEERESSKSKTRSSEDAKASEGKRSGTETEAAKTRQVSEDTKASKRKKSSDDNKISKTDKSSNDKELSTDGECEKTEPNKNENKAAELDLLKELADEIDESNDSPPEEDEKEKMENGEDEEEISSDSDSSVSSREFGKRKTRRLRKEKKVSEESSKKSSKTKRDNKEEAKKASKSKKEKGKVSLNSDDDFKKDSKKLSKDSKKSKEDKTEKTEKKQGKKETSKTKKGEDEEYHSDSSNFDADLEKDIKSLSKDTKVTRRSSRTTTKKSDDKASVTKSKKSDKSKKSKKEKSTDDSDDSNDSSSDESDDENEVEDVEDQEEDGLGDEEDEVDEDDLSPSQLRKLRAAQKEEEAESDYEDMEASDNSDSEDPEISFPKLETPKKGKKKSAKNEASDDSDFVTPKKKTRKGKVKSELLDAKVSDSDSDVEPPKKKKRRGRKRKKEESEEEEPHPEDEVYSDDGKKKKGKRKRIKKVASSSEEEKEKKEEGEEGDDDLEDTPGGAHKRKKIRKVMANKKLADTTKEARKLEDERRKRIEERQKEFNAYVEVEGGESEEELPEGTEREKKEVEGDSITKLLGTARKVPVTTRCVLDMDKDTKKVLVEIDRTLVKKLKPHQVEAVRFMYNCCVESIERMKKEEGAGCILAHCMGLGKTLSVITFIHTMLSHTKLTKMTKCLVVCPLNTVLNWVNEFEIWLDDVDFEIDVYEMSKVKQNYERAKMLREWHEGGAGVMILGYDMYRNLVMGSHCKNKKQKATFYETLANPGPDLVVCDEGHILKNDSTSLSKSMSKIITKRRVVLTGTPLQNNLGEYHCMVDFVKPSLLGTRKEFSNRFVNPITNGQCTDSSISDVKLMKRRAHILHEMLAGCVQRKDYSALTKFLPPKFEYVISVRMGKLQCTLYEQYLKEVGVVQNEEVQGKGGRLFRDYQALMRIWTHPWVLKLDEIRQENKRTYDSEDSFIDDDESDEDSFISQSTTSESDSDFGGKKKKSKGKKGKKRRGSGSSSDDDVKEVNDGNEVIRKWSSKRRGNEEGAGSSWMADMGYSTGPKEVSSEWWAEYVKEEDEYKIELSGKLTLMFEILKMCEDIGDKVLVFSQSLLSLDIIEDFLHHIDESNSSGETGEDKKDDKENTANGETETGDKDKKDKKGEDTKAKDDEDDKDDKDKKKKDKYSEYGKSWSLGADYFRMDGSTNSQQRKSAQDSFNDPENFRARLFLISTKAGSLGINLVAANRVIIFDASWNPSHDIQSIFRVYRFGQVKPVYVYRFLAQGTMEEKIYERQVTKQSLSQRVVDEHQIERHFTSSDLQELYRFQPDRLDDPDRKERPLPMLPKDHMLAELMGTQKDWLVTFHEHDSLLENIVEQELSEEEKKAAWEDYENEKKGLNTAYPGMYGNMMNATQRMTSALEFQNLVLQGQANLGQEAVLQIVQDLKARFPTLPPEVFSQRVQAVLRQVLTQRIMQQSDFQRRQLDQQKMAELNRLNQIKQQIQQQQAMLNNQQRGAGLGNFSSNSLYGVQALPSSGYFNSVMPPRSGNMGLGNPPPAHSSNKTTPKPNPKGDK